jgi:PAS domain S-box-containing protein
MHSPRKAIFEARRPVPFITGTSVLLLGLLAMAGWVFKIPALVQVGADSSVMQFNSGLGFAWCGAGLLALASNHRAIAQLCGGLAGALGLLTLAEYATGSSLGIDTVAIQPFMSDARFPVGRMAPATALAFMVSGAAILTAASPIASRWPTLAVSAPGIGLIALSAFGFTEYLARLLWGTQFGYAKGMAVHSAFGFMLLGAGVVSIGLVMQREERLSPQALAGASGSGARGPSRWMSPAAVTRIAAFIASIGLPVTSLYRAAQRWNGELTTLFHQDLDRDLPGVRGSFALRYGLAVASIALATWVRLLLDPAVGFQFPYATLFFAVLLTAWFGGFGPAVLSVLLGALFSAYFLLPPRGSFSLEGWDQQAGMLLFLGTSLGIALLGGSMHAAQWRAHASARRIEAQRKALAEENTKREVLNEELKVSEERFRKVFDDGPLAMAMSTTDFMVTHVNARFCKMLGYSESELLRLTFKDFTHPDDRDVKTGLNEKLLRGEIPIFHLESRYVRKDRTILYGSQTAVVVRDNQGQPQFFLAMVEDITARKQAEEALRVSEERFRKVFDDGPLGMTMSTLDNRLTHVNAQFCGMLGYSESELLQLTYPEFTHSGDRSTKTELVGRLLRGEIPVLQLENRYLRKDGGILHGSQTAVLVRDNQGQPQFFLAMVEDITARKQAEEALLVSEDRFRRVVESHPNALVIVDSLGRIKQLNSRALVCFGYTQDELMGQPVEILLPEPLREAHRAERSAYLTAPAARTMGSGLDLHGRRKDGSTFPVDVGLSPLETAQGLDVIAAVVDVTARKEAELALSTLNLELASANRELESFAYAVSHDLRQPLRGITGFCKMLVEDYGRKLEPEAQRYIKTIVDSAEKMGQLIDDLLKLSRISRDQMDFQTVDLGALSRQVANDLREIDPARQVVVEIEAGLTTQGDGRLLKVLLENLIGNAWKFTSQGEHARISIGRRTHNGTNAFFVADNGVGFNMKYVDKLFSPFQRLHKATEFEGTGIGLATVKRIVDRHGGRIWAEAQEGKGASFYFSW